MQQADAPASSVLVRARSSKCSMVVGWQAALLWAVLCSVALRDSRDRLVAEAERLLDGTRSLFRVAATLTLMPLSALSANLEVRGCHLRGLEPSMRVMLWCWGGPWLAVPRLPRCQAAGCGHHSCAAVRSSRSRYSRALREDRCQAGTLGDLEDTSTGSLLGISCRHSGGHTPLGSRQWHRAEAAAARSDRRLQQRRRSLRKR